MSKCLYTESDVTQSGAQLLISDISLDGQEKTPLQKKFRHAFPEASSMMDKVLSVKDELFENDIMYKKMTTCDVGDVIWANAGGNRHIGFCIVKEKSDSAVNKQAVELCIKSAKAKAKELNIGYVGMGLFASETPQQWADIVELVEDSLDDIQGVVCIPTNDELVEVLENLPGPKNFRMLKNK